MSNTSSEPHTNWPVVAVAIGCGVLGAVHFGKVPPALPELRQAFGLDLPTAGFLASSFSLAGAALGTVAGVLADRLGRLRVLVGGLVLIACGSLLAPTTQAAGLLLGARGLESAGFLAVAVTVPGLIVQATTAADRRLALGIWGAYMPAGMTLAMAIAPSLQAAIGWRGLWGALGVVTLGIAAAAMLVVRGLPRPAAPGAIGAALRTVAGRPGPWVLALAFGTYALQWAALVTWLPSFMIEQLALTPSTAGLLTALVVFANVPGNVIGGVLVNRGVPRWVLIAVAQATMGASMLAMQLAPIPDLARYAAAILFSLVGGLLPASVLAGAPRHAGDPSRIGLVNGMIVQGANLGTVSGPPILAFLVATLGNWQVASPLIAGFALMGIGAALALRKVEARP